MSRYYIEEEESSKNCYRCGNNDHLLKDCKEEPICYKCGQRGHSSQACESSKKTTNKDKILDYHADIITDESSIICVACNKIGHLNCVKMDINKNRAKLYCLNCGSDKHSGEDCRKYRMEPADTFSSNNNYYNDFSFQTNNNNRNLNYTDSIECWNCKGKGHFSKDCPEKNKRKRKTNFADNYVKHKIIKKPRKKKVDFKNKRRKSS